jgi:hypothetical protein|tara:strand:- start:742 stop:942 length:201 start_codon:yes stop_codon:yes gene_type:complete
MTIKPDTIFECWTVDEVAECMDGISDNLYKSLWNKASQRVNVSELWDQFTEDEQLELNKSATIHKS